MHGSSKPALVRRRVLPCWGRWHGTKSGSLVAETDDIKGLYEWTSQWSDLLDFTVTPVMDDAELAEVLKRIGS
jgi:Protein of unknown function (DUF3303)